MTPSSSYRKVALFAFYAAAVVSLCLVGGGITGTEALAALSTAYTAALGLNVWENHKAAVRHTATPSARIQQPARPRPGSAPFERVEPSDRTDFEPERPAVDRETLVTLLADMMAERAQKR